MTPPWDVLIVGGGLSGLALAAELERLAAAGDGCRVQVLERGERPGGKIRTVAAQGFRCESGPNGWLDKEPATFDLVRRLALTDELLPAGESFDRRYLLRRGRLVPVAMHPLRFLASPLLPTRAKLRLALEPLVHAPREPPPDESVAHFARRRIGADAARILVDAMQQGIFAGDPRHLSVRSCFPRVVEVEREHGSLIKGMIRIARQRKRSGGPLPGAGPSGRLTSLAEGLEQLVDRLARALARPPICGAEVTRIERGGADGSAYTAHTADGARHAARALVLACPAHGAAPLLAPLSPQLAAELAAIEYAPLAVVALGYHREQVAHALDGFGFLAPRGEGLRSLGALFSSSNFHGRAPAGQVLLRVMVGGVRDPAVLELDPQRQLLPLVRHELAPVLGLRGQPTLARVFGHRRAIPQYNLGHRRRLERIAEQLTALPGLLLAGNAYHGIGINDCVANARPLAARVLAQLAGAAPTTAAATPSWAHQADEPAR